MPADVTKYRGFDLNVEIGAGGRFVPAYHDPLRFAKDCWKPLPECAADRQDECLANAREWLDCLVRAEMEEVEAEARQRGYLPL